MQYTKQAVNALVSDALSRSFDLATALEIVTFGSEDHAEALAALSREATTGVPGTMRSGA